MYKLNNSGGAVTTVLATIAGIIVFAVAIVSLIGINFVGIHVNGFLNKERVNVETEVFRGTQAYVQGKHQDLANYYKEYQKLTDPMEKAAIRTIVGAQFADFNTDTLNSQALRSFLVTMRGY